MRNDSLMARGAFGVNDSFRGYGSLGGADSFVWIGTLKDCDSLVHKWFSPRPGLAHGLWFSLGR